MKLVVQRVSSAQILVAQEVVATIGVGLVILVGVARGDTEADAHVLAEKVANLRIFEDDAGKMNLSIMQTSGHALVVSQFTLLANTSRGRRPSFIEAAEPNIARGLYESFAADVAAHGIHVQRGRFGAHMQVTLTNDGPVTVLMESEMRQ